MVISPIETKSMAISTKQQPQLLPLPLDLVLNGAKIDQVSEHRLLGINIDNFAGTLILIMCAKQFQDESSFCSKVNLFKYNSNC